MEAIKQVFSISFILNLTILFEIQHLRVMRLSG